MKPVRVHPQAEKEADAAFDRYLEQSRTAAFGFDKELRGAYQSLRVRPLTFPPYLYGTRRVILDRYPFSVIFRERLHDIQIVAVAHAKRRPGYWAKRLKH
jgi:plasmid stabilization system protein ParE